MSLTPEQIAIIKSTVPVIAEHGLSITTLMYKNMLAGEPSLNNIFNRAHQGTGRQPIALAGSLYAYASYIDDLSALTAAVELICHKHASLYIRAPHYAIVGRYLMDAMKTVLGDALTPEIATAWGAAYGQLADLFIVREKELYDTLDQWSDWRDFRVARKEREGDDITSFYLEPVDGVTLPTYLPGQYICVRVHVPALDCMQPRQYSLSDAPSANGSYYRISVKREEGGAVSTILHDKTAVGDVLQVAHPYGDFTFDAESGPNDAPVVLLAAGVGITCLFSILKSIAVAGQAQRPVSWIQVARNKSLRAFDTHISEVSKTLPQLRVVHFTSQPTALEVQGTDYDFAGRLAIDRLDAQKDLHLNDERAQYFVCGPDGYMADTYAALKQLGVPASRIHMELFGTGGVVKA
jgi:nitric oxide dioxygenase